MLSGDAQTVFANARQYNLIGSFFLLSFYLENRINKRNEGESQVWLCSDGCSQSSVYTIGGVVNATIRDAMKGMIGTVPQGFSFISFFLNTSFFYLLFYIIMM